LEIPSLAQRYGIFGGVAGSPGAKPLSTAVLDGRGEIRSPLLWLAQRLAKNRERLGVHYPSDSSASRHLAAAVWRALLYGDEGYATECPTLVDVLTRASAEW
jgi:membrane-associated phospholipid phosphatase